MKRLKIRTLLVLMVAAVSVPLATLSLANVWLGYQAGRVSLGKSLLDTSRALSLTVDREIGQAQGMIETLAASDVARERDLEGLDRYARELIAGRDGFVILMADRTGQQLISTSLPFGSALPARASMVGVDRVFETGEPFVSDVFLDAVLDVPVVGIDVPVTVDGRVDTVLTVLLPLGGISDILGQQRIDARWIAGVLDRLGNHVARSRDWESFVLQQPAETLVAAIRREHQGVVEAVTPDGIPVLGGYSTSPRYGWTVYVHVPLEIVEGGLVGRALTNLAILAAVAGLAMAAAFVLGGWIARPIQALVPAARQIGDGVAPEVAPSRLAEVEDVRLSLSLAATALVHRAQERDKALADLGQLNQVLEERVASRTEELREKHEALLKEVESRTATEAQLRQAQKMEAVGALTGGVAHDFNNLLQIIQANLELVRGRVPDLDVRDRVDQALEGTRRGASLTRQLLAFARKQPLEPKPINPGRLLRGMMDLLRRTMGEQVDVETMIAGGLWNCRVDPNQLETALLNLAVNARDAMGGGGKLTVEVDNAFLDHKYAALHSEVTPGQYVMIAVTDTGAGIEPKTMERVFEPFFTTKAVGRGTGLGLSQVFGFVKQSGGHVKVYSEVGVGTTVKIYLPRTREAELGDGDRPGQPDLPAGLTVLLVEDEPEVRAGVAAMLRDLGLMPVEAGNGEEALARLDGLKLDLLLTDVVMPGPVSSRELARRVAERQPGAAILFTSGYTENAIIHQGELDADVHLISKPFGQAELAQKIAVVLSAKTVAVRPDDGLDGGTPPALNVLLVEDDPLIGMTGAEMIEELGHSVVLVASFEAALDALEGNDVIDVVLTDVSLPGRSGTELATTIRERFSQVPVVAVTGLDSRTVNEAGVFDAVIPKPYEVADIRACLSRLHAAP